MKEDLITIGDIQLTQRQLDILKLSADGLTNKKIAGELELSKKTIEHYLSNDTSDDRAIYPKIGAESKIQAAIWYENTFGKSTLGMRITSSTDLQTPASNQVSISTINLKDVDVASASLPEIYELGTRLITAGLELSDRSLWKDALTFFRKAEDVLLGTASSEAARAACYAALMHAELGDYERAQKEVIRIQHTYKSILDPETEEVLYRVKAWVNYYQGNFIQAERWFRECLKIAERTGHERIGETAQHFIGRVYLDWGQTLGQKEKANVLFHKAKVNLEKSYQLHLKWGFGEGERAFDFFRKAQLLRVEHKWHEARQLRNKARHMFVSRYPYNILHVDLEEAMLALENGEIRTPKLKAEEALKRWAHINKSSGMADALKILGDLECTLGKPDLALEPYVAALCIYPYENNLSNRQLRAKITDICLDIIHREGRKAYHKLRLHIHELAENRQGSFSYLNNVTADRSADIPRVLSRLNPEKL